MATISPPPRRPPGEGRAPTYAHAVEAFLVAHDRTGAWSAGTAVKYRQSLTILGTRLAEGPIGASVAALDTPRGRRTWRQRSLPPSRRWPRLPAPGTSPRCARHWGGGGPGLAGDRPHRRLGPTQDRPRPQQGSDSGADRRPLVPGRRPTREDPVAAAV
jgi:hypothetical protein